MTSIIAAGLAVLPILPLLAFPILLATDPSNGPLGYALFLLVPIAVVTIPLLSLTALITAIIGMINSRPIDKKLSLASLILLGVNTLLIIGTVLLWMGM